MPVFLEYIFQFLINNALPASNSVDRQNFIDNAFTLYVDGPGFDSRRWKLSFPFLGGTGVAFVLFCLFSKTYFRFFDKLKIYR